MMSTAERISRRGFRPTHTVPGMFDEMPCLHPDAALDDTGR